MYRSALYSCLLFLVLLVYLPIVRSLRLVGSSRRASVVKCYFATDGSINGPSSDGTKGGGFFSSPAASASSSQSGGMQQYPPFYIPANDRELYENGVKELLSQMGASKENLSVHCEDCFETDVHCKLCLYNEISEDRAHMRQGQVVGVLLNECMEGKFNQGEKMIKSDFHPICYPPIKDDQNPDAKSQNLTSIAKEM